MDFQNTLTEDEDFNIIDYLYFNNGGGVAVGDINNDGLDDLYFGSNQESNRLYLNTGGLRFEDITESAGVAGSGDWTTGLSMADVNGDGLLDIYVCQVSGYKGLQGRNQLFINQGDLSFRDMAPDYGLDFQGFSTQAAFFDYDADGDLDLYLLNHSVHSSRSYGRAGLREEVDDRAGDRLYRNDPGPDGPRFTDVTGEAGIYRSQIGYGLGVGISDVNLDGWPDIYISNDFHEQDYLYINRGNGTFREQLREGITATSRSSMGNDLGDINNDGWPDIVVLDMLPDEQTHLKSAGGEDEPELFRLKLDMGYGPQFVRNTLQLNVDGLHFQEIGRFAGVAATDWSWGPLLCDLDNDGWMDLFITSGIFRRANDLDYIQFLTGGNRYFPDRDNSGVPDKTLYEKMPLQPDVNHVFRNDGNLRFTAMEGMWGLERADYSNGSAYADLDRDGDPDLVVNNINGPASVIVNRSESLEAPHFLALELTGRGGNTGAIGTRVLLYAGGRVQTREKFTSRGFLSASTGVLLFGLGETATVDSLRIVWPGNRQQTLYGIEADRYHALREPEPDAEQSALPAISRPQTSHAPRFREISLQGVDFVHREDPYEDLNREPLLPHNLSKEGPALAIADVNGDGLDDFFIGGAKDQTSRLYLQVAGGGFRQQAVEELRHDTYAEDVDAAFFDADGDGDADLYIVRAGNEYLEGNPLLDDCLLLNDGTGKFSDSGPERLPPLFFNGSCVRPFDFDGDGDLDIFLGIRSVPGVYGMSPRQVMLVNEGDAHFRVLSDAAMGELLRAGMVTDAVWTDVSGDGKAELVVAGEWMPVQVYETEGEASGRPVIRTDWPSATDSGSPCFRPMWTGTGMPTWWPETWV
ncbi:MAG: CRTAC1 family protein [Bacteroidales bacterium]